MPDRRIAASIVRVFSPFLAVLALATALRAQLVTITWNGGSADWTSTSNWSLAPTIPSAVHSAQITSGTVTVSTSPTVGALNLSGGTLNGAGTLTITSTGSQWNGGTLSGSGTIAFDSGTSLGIGGSGTLNARRLTNSGSITWSSGTLSTGNGAIIDNFSGATFSLTGDNTLSYNQGGTRTIINNAGAFNKSSGTGTSDIQATFNNTGSVTASTGTLQFSGGGSNSSTMTAASGATIRFSNDFTLAAGSTLAGAGTFSATGGTLTANGAIAATNLSLAGASLAGSPAFTGNITWSSGDWNLSSGTATTTITSGSTLAISSTNVHDFNRRALVNNGTFNWSGGQLRSGNGGSITNATGATFTDTASNSINAAYGGTVTFTNDGTYNKSGAGTTSFSVGFTNNGTINLTAGTLSFLGGGNITSGSTINVGPGTTLDVGSGNLSAVNASSLVFTGTGNATVTGGSLTVTNGAFAPATLNVTSGALTLSDPAANSTISAITISGGSITTLGTLTTPALTQSNGSIIASNLALTGNATWSGGDWNTSAASTASIASGTTLTASTTNVHDFNRRTITNSGIFEWTGGQLRSGNGGGFVNAAGATFNDAANNSFNNAYGGTITFSNAGTYNKTGSGTSSMGATFTNTGTVNINAGAFSFDAGGSASGTSLINLASGATLRFGGGNFTIAGASNLALSGNVSITSGNVTLTSGQILPPALTISGGTLTLADAAGNSSTTALTLSSGGLQGAGAFAATGLTQTGGSIANAALTLNGNSTWTGGDWSSASASVATIANGVTLSLTTSSVHDFNRRTITNNGTLDWQSGQFRTGNGGGFTNAAGATVNDAANSFFNAAYGGSATFNNAGTYNKTGSGTSAIQTAFNNTGTVNLNAGTLSLEGGGSATGTSIVNVAAGTTLQFGGGNFTIAGASNLSLTGNVSITSGNVTLTSGALTPPLLTITGGTLSLADAAAASAIPTISLSSGTLKSAGTVSTNAFTQSSGSVEAAVLSILGNSTWSGGDWNSGVATTASIASGVTFTASSTNVHDFNRRTITNNGTFNWTGGQLRSGNGGGFVNASGATFNDSANSFFNAAYGGSATFANAGTYNKTGTGTTTFSSALDNTGAFNLSAGTLALDGGGSASGASVLTIAAGTTLRFGGGNFTIASASNLAATGTVSVTGGKTTLSAGTFNLPILTLSGGTLDGAGTIATPSLTLTGGSFSANALTLTGNATWSSGDLNSSAASTATIGGGATLSLTTTNVHDFNRRTITNNGTLDWQSGQFRTGNGGGFINTAGAVVNDAASSFFNAAYGGSATFTNNGTYNKTASGTSTFQSTFDNNGTTNVNAGTLSLSGGGSATSAARFNLASGTTLNFGGGNYTLADGASLAVAGTANVSLTGGSLAVGSGNVDLPTLTVTGGALGGAGNATIANFNQSGGSLDIAAFTLTGPIAWTSGDWSSPSASTATLASGTTLNLTTSSSHDFDRRAVTVNGATNWSSGYIRSGNGGLFTNNGTFTDTITNGYTIHNAFGGTFSFVNNGTYQRNATGTTSYIDVPFVNNGTLSVLAGDLQLRNGGSVAGGATVSVASGANLYLTDGWTVANGVSLGGAGGYFLTNGTFDVSGALAVTTFNMSGGTLAGTHSLSGVFNWSGGTWSAGSAQTTTIASGGTLNLTSGSSKDFNRRNLINDGTINWSGGYIRAGTGSVFTNNGLFVDTQASGWSFHNPFGGTFTIVNNGTYRRSGAGTTSYIDVPFTNNASVQVQAGDLQFRAGGTLAASGNIAVSAGANVYFTDGFNVANGASLTGAGGYFLTNGTFSVTGTMNVSTFNQSGGTLAGTPTLNGIFNWSNGTWSTGTAGQSTTIASGATLNLTTGSSKDFDQRNVTNLGTVNWNGGYIRAGHGSVFTNNGLFVDAQTSGWSFHNPFGGTFTVVNNGTYRRDAANTSYMDTAFDNNGTLDVRQGDFQIRAGGTLASSGTIAVATGANVYFTNGYNVSNGASLTGAGAYHLTGGTFNVTGTMNVSTFNQSGGRLEGTNIINGTYNWSGGDWSTGTAGRSTTIVAGATLNLFGGANKDLDLRAVVNAGTTTWTQGYIRGGNGATFTNAAGGTFLDQNASGYSVHNPFGGTFVFVNNGTYTRNVGGTTYFDTPFNNNGTLNLQQGDIEIRQGGTMGAASVVNGTTGTNLFFRDSYTLLDGAQFLGSGNFIQTGGNLSIEGTLAASAFHWQNGAWSATATSSSTTIGSGTVLNLTTGGNKDFTGRTITNQGTVNWYQGYIRGGQGATFVNNGTFNDVNSSGYTVHNPFGGTFSFTNNGSYVRNTGGATYFDAPFNNNGTVALQQGDIYIRQGGTMSATSVVNVSTGANFVFRDDYTLLSGARFTGTGNIMQDGGTLTINGVLRASAFNWNSGNWNIATTDPTATTTIDGGTTLNLVSGNNKDFSHRTILNQGTVNWYSGYIRAGQGAVFENAVGGVFNDANVSGYTVHNAYGGTFAFVNRGTYVRNVGGATYFDVAFDNYGTLNLQQGDLHLRQGGTMAATSVVNTSTGANLYLTNDYTLLSGSSFVGPGGVTQTGGTLTANGLLTAAAFNWYAGDWNTASLATTTIASGSTLNLVSGNNKDFSGRAIVNQGTTNWVAGYLRGGQGGSFTNAAGGVFNDQNASGYTVHNAFGGTFSFTNAGTYNKLTSGTTTFDVPFTNTGTINLNAGALVFHSTFTNSGSLAFANGASAHFSAPLNLGTAALTGSGTIFASSVTAGGLVSPGNSPGTLSLTGNLTLLGTSNLLIELGGTTAGTNYDVLSVGGTALLAGTLQLSLTNSFWPTSANTFTILTANGVTGTFGNALNNSRLATLDGFGSFLVSYNASNVTLSNFQAIPEPSTYVLLSLGSLMVFLGIRRRRA